MTSKRHKVDVNDYGDYYDEEYGQEETEEEMQIRMAKEKSKQEAKAKAQSERSKLLRQFDVSNREGIRLRDQSD